MDHEDQEGYEKLIQVLNFLKNTTNIGIIFNSSKTLTWNLEFYSESDFSGDTSNRKSISGYLIYVNGNLISWTSKHQPIVTTSSTEDE